MSGSWREIQCILAFVILAFGLNGGAFGSDENALTNNFRLEFSSRNPVLTRIRILESKPLSSKKDSSTHVYLVHAIRPDRNFVGKFEDEQFGIFLVNANQKQIVKVLDVFNTPRWLDYDIKIKRVSPTKVIVIGGGATYGDQPIIKTYEIGGIQ